MIEDNRVPEFDQGQCDPKAEQCGKQIAFNKGEPVRTKRRSGGLHSFNRSRPTSSANASCTFEVSCR